MDTLKHIFEQRFVKHKEKRALGFYRKGVLETEISYAELHDTSNRMANAFLGMGVEKGDRVAFYLDKSLFHAIAHIALQKIGAVSMPLNPGFKIRELRYFLRDAEPKLVLSGPDLSDRVKEALPSQGILTVPTERPFQHLSFYRSSSGAIPDIPVDSEDPGLLIYTSGTTGEPKGAVLSQKNLVSDALSIISIWEISDSDVMCHALPLYHVHGLCFALHTIWLAGGSVLMTDSFSAGHVLEMLSVGEGDRACTVFMAVPTMYRHLMAYSTKKKLHFDHIRLWTSGSAPLRVQDFKRIKEAFGKAPVEREGMTETGMNFSNPLKGERKPGSIGCPLPGLDVRIVDPVNLKELPGGKVGEIWLKGPSVFSRYWKKPEQTARAFEKGWFRTGDMGRMDADGYYYLTDRLKHIIISGGENVSPKEVESVIDRHPDVVESSVFGVADEKWGERVVAAVIRHPESELTAGDIKNYCKKHLHDWKCPKEIRFVRVIPKNRMGKVLRDKLKNDLFIDLNPAV